MLNVFANMMNIATRNESWSPPDHWRNRDPHDRRSADEAELDRLRTRRALRHTGTM